MFESFYIPSTPEWTPGVRVFAPEGEPLEFAYQGQHFLVQSILSRWYESGRWWIHIDDDQIMNTALDGLVFDNGHRGIWHVEAVPRTPAIFDIEFDELGNFSLIDQKKGRLRWDHSIFSK